MQDLSTQLATAASEAEGWQREASGLRARLATVETAARGKAAEVEDVRRAYEVAAVPVLCVQAL